MAYSVWEVVIFILNSLIFILLGLQLRSVMQGIGDYPVGYISIVWNCNKPGGHRCTVCLDFAPCCECPLYDVEMIKDNVDPRNIVVFGWAGMRGVVSMAAALALPLTIK